MRMPDTGLIITSCYNIALVQLSEVQSLTFIPLHSSLPEKQKIICIEFIRDNHFIELKLKECSRIPHIIRTWMRYHEVIAEDWERHYKSRITLSQPQSGSTMLVELDDVI
ncbi:hypothetical protein KSP39_PZI004379 [Platanthera zijinensis]|uniref:Uncharacterized protein n=1 Tax=Platanthera zijinensis TaxID=2320716 RepID=A0AAP0BVL5_9ASPA